MSEFLGVVEKLMGSSVLEQKIPSLTKIDSVGSESSVLSFFGDRPGVMNLPDTLSTNVVGISPVESGAFTFLVEQALKYKFNVHANLIPNDDCYRTVVGSLLDSEFSTLDLTTDSSVVFTSEDKSAYVTVVLSESDNLPLWSEDIIFMGTTVPLTYQQKIADWG
jgi:hypothetical protein